PIPWWKMCSFSSILHHLTPLFGPYPSLLQHFPFLLKLPLLSYIHLQHLNRLFLLRFLHWHLLLHSRLFHLGLHFLHKQPIPLLKRSEKVPLSISSFISSSLLNE